MSRVILLVDDVDMNREILKKILGAEYSYLEADNGVEAIAVLHRSCKFISAVLLDLSMPVMDGFEVLRQMRNNALFMQIPVIVMTGNAESEAEEQALKLGACDYIVKPYNAVVVKQRIRNMINLRETSATVNSLQRDRLTGLFSREAFFERVAQSVKLYPPGHYMLSCFNIANFKVVNDQYGADCGDMVLKHVANCFKQFAAVANGLCCRIMADNFALFYPTFFCNSDVLNDYHKSAMYPPALGRPINIRIGRYLIDDLSLTPSAMYDRASLAENSIRGQYDIYIAQYDESMRIEILREQEIVNDMNDALASGQFEMWLQPQYNHSSGAIIGSEALVRWRHPEKGLISPALFIPIFEKNGFIYEMDKFIWEEACRHLRKWIDEGRMPLPLSVNISRYDIFRPDIVSTLIGYVKNYDISTDLLRLEITESAFAESTEQIVDVVKKLIDYGFTVEIDDFGSGYSSLNTLKNVPAQVLKLDMRFLEESDGSQRGGNILESVVRMAKWLDMSVIAEGVEDQTQADFLKSIGCNYVQGFLYAKPMCVGDFEKLCADVAGEERFLKLETVESLDSNTFWDPDSIDSLIFNSYVGSACIFELNNGKVELLRVTDKYIDMITGLGLPIDCALTLNWNDYLDEASRSAFFRALNTSIAAKMEVTEEYRFVGLPHNVDEMYLNTTMRVIASSGSSYLVYCINQNVTGQRIAEREARRASEQSKAIMDDAGSGITAAVIENGTHRFLFSNDTYYNILGYTRSQYSEEVTDHLDLINPEDRDNVRKAYSEAFESKSPVRIEYRAMRRDGEERWLRAILSATNFTGLKETVQLCILTDITAEKQAESIISDTDNQLRFLNEAAHDLLSQPDSDKGINATLRRTLNYFDGSRAYVFELNAEGTMASNTYEVCANGVAREMEQFQDIPIDSLPFWLRAFDTQSFIDITDVDNAISSAASKSLLKQMNIRSLIAVPIRRGEHLVGYIGVHDPKKHHTHVERLVAIGDYIAFMLTRRDLNARIVRVNQLLSEMINDIPCAFIRLRYIDKKTIIPVYFNKNFQRLVGFSSDELMKAYNQDAFFGIHPDDRSRVALVAREMLSDREAHTCKFRMRRSSDDYVLVMAFGRAVSDESGKIFLNINYIDSTEQTHREEVQRELLDNIPYGAALYEYNGKSLRAMHLNKRYWELTGRTPKKVSGTGLDAVHPDDKPVLLAEIKSAVRQQRDMQIYLRLRCGANKYRPFSLVARIVSHADGKHSIYSIFTPMSEESLSYREMMPLLFSAIMESSSDLSFAKDRNFRYICGSRAFATMAGLESERDLVNKTDYDLFDKETADQYRRDDEQLFESEKPMIDKVESIPSTDGVSHFSSTSKYLLRDASGNVLGLFGCGRDITAYRDAFDKLKLLTDTMPGGLASIEYSPRGARMLFFSDGFYRYSGYSREEYIEATSGNLMFLVVEEDIPNITDMIDRLRESRDSVSGCTYRCRTKDGTLRWFIVNGAVSDVHEDSIVINFVQFDATERKTAEAQLRLKDEEYRLAISHGGNAICRYNVADQSTTIFPEIAATYSLPEREENVPYGSVARGVISEETRDAYIAFYEGIRNGSREGSASFERLTDSGWRWLDANYSTLFSDTGEPVSAVLTFRDVTEQRNKEAIYKKWQQSLREKAQDSYTLLRCNLSKNTFSNSVEGTLLQVFLANDETFSFNERTEEYAENYVLADDRAEYIKRFNCDSMLASYYRGNRTDYIEYREKLSDGNSRWLSCSIELVEYPKSTDIIAYLMYEDIDERKHKELQVKNLVERDPLTGVYNRSTFSSNMNRILRDRKPGFLFALLIFDLDGFKLVNDRYGHARGDQVLVDVSKRLGALLRRNDLIGRLGGDEFMFCMSDAASRAAIGKKAQSVCNCIRKSFASNVQISASLGIAVCPDDGDSFETLYRKADVALYHVKGKGKDSYAFYSDDMLDDRSYHGDDFKAYRLDSQTDHDDKKRRMLIVDDSKANREVLVNLFHKDYHIDTVDNGGDALIFLRRYGSGLSVVLLDLVMPGMDGYAVLEKMRSSPEMQSIPVVVVSGMDEREASLKAIRYGASDFVTKPIDPELLLLRVEAAVSKSENDRNRARDSHISQ